jgi:hypothetical protein
MQASVSLALTPTGEDSMRRAYLLVTGALLVLACDSDPAEPPPPDREERPGVAAALIPPPACTKSWTSGIGGLWSDPSRWTPAGAPNSTDDVCIDAAGTYDVTHTLPIDVRSLRIGGTGASVTFDFDSPQFGVGIMTEDGIWIESGSTLNVLSVGGVPLTATSGNLTVAGRLDIENTCACGGDVATLDFPSIHNSGRMTLDAPITLGWPGTNWVNHPGSVIVTAGTGVINAGGHIFESSGTIVGSTAIEVGGLVWRDGSSDTIAPVTSVVLVTGGWLSLIGDTQEGRVDAVTRNTDRLTLAGRTVNANVIVEIALQANDSLEIVGGTATAPFLVDGVLAISSNGSNVVYPQ